MPRFTFENITLVVHADLLTCSVFERKDHDVFDSVVALF